MGEVFRLGKGKRGDAQHTPQAPPAQSVAKKKPDTGLLAVPGLSPP